MAKHTSSLVLSAPDTVSQTSAAIDAVELYAASFQASFGDASAAGTIHLEASNDITHAQYIPATFTPTNWTIVPNTTETVTAGASTLIPYTLSSYRWLRVVFTSSAAGTTTITVNMFALSY